MAFVGARVENEYGVVGVIREILNGTAYIEFYPHYRPDDDAGYRVLHVPVRKLIAPCPALPDREDA